MTARERVFSRNGHLSTDDGDESRVVVKTYSTRQGSEMCSAR